MATSMSAARLGAMKQAASALLRRPARARSLYTFATPGEVDIPNVPVPEYVTENFSKFGDKPALVDGVDGRTITYRDLYHRIGCAAKGMAEKGIADGDVVNIHLPNMPEYIVAFQGVASLGAVNTTSNPLYTPDELAHQYRDSNAKYAITIPQLLPTVQEAAKKSNVKDIFVVGEPSANFLFANDGKTAPRSVPMDPAEKLLVLPYSSGTTGLAKGVMLTHRNMVANVQQIIAHPTLHADLKPSDVCLGLLPMYHIYGMTFVTTSCIRQGTTVVTLPKFDPMLFLQTLQKHKITYAPLVPPIINFMARHPAVDKFDLSSLRVVFSGAAPLDAVTQSALQDRLKQVSARQGYGMTEMSPVSHIPLASDVVPGSVGRTVANCESMIRNVDDNSSMPPGPDNIGELCVRGPNVMKGYLHNATATNATIIDGWMHTGDLAWHDERGNVFVVDRLKELIKSKGFQVPPAELEGLMLQMPGVADCAAVGAPHERHGEVPVAFVVRRNPAGTEPTEEQVKEFIASRTADYKHLARVVFIDAIPKNASGKVLRRVLREKL